jgi:hypothetical protein
LARDSRFGRLDGFWGRRRPTETDPDIIVADLRVNEASYAFIAAIIAGMPMMFITRVML